MNSNNDPDFAPIATRIRNNVGRQGFMAHIGAELSELTRWSKLTIPAKGDPVAYPGTPALVS